ncbi:hypothetical protein DFH29DRAFT_1081304 [Suillus ampliporus]|nr:hypothetical protein DFH29DRAFT_1081304 [Suillus ampliporus]
MSTTTRNMERAPSKPSLAPVDTDFPTSEDELKPKAASEEPAVSIEGGLAKNMSNTLEHILDVLRGSTIAEELGKDVNSKFWATYKKVSSEYDDDFLERANDDMGIILTFAGLFSAVNSTFIIGMQPNPGDTTNDLLLHLIKITAYGPSAVSDISSLSSFTGYPSSIVWMRTLAYASLAFSVLAAFGAVLGKQWLNSYKAARGSGSLENRGIQRQMKLDGLEHFHLHTVLQAFLVLLQISLLLFGLSLSASIWIQQTTISSVIICTTAFGILFYAGTILVSALRPDSPFRTPGSDLVGAICTKFLSVSSTLTPTIFTKSSAIRWILETSTNPEVIEAAAAMVPLVQWPPKMDASAAYARLRDYFQACRGREELYVKCGKAMAHLCIQPVNIHSALLGYTFYIPEFRAARSHFIRDAFLAGRDACDQLKNTREDDAKPTHKADARTALRTMVVHGMEYQLSLPDDELVIWYGDLQWRHNDGQEPGCDEFDWLIDYLEDEAGNDATEGDALLALSAMHGLGSTAKRPSYIRSLIRCMGPTRPHRVRHAALRAVSDARGELASITSNSMPQGVDAKLLDELSSAFLTATRPNDNQKIHDSIPTFHEDRDRRYGRLIFSLTKNDEWRQRLTSGGHLERCIGLLDEAWWHSDLPLYLLTAFGLNDSSGKDLPFSPARHTWQLLVNTWGESHYRMRDDDYVDVMPALVAATRLNLPSSDNGPSKEWLADLTQKVHQALSHLQDEDVRACFWKNGVARAAVDTATSSAQGFYDDLCRMTEDRNTT